MAAPRPRGFTLLEIVIVIAIISIAASTSLPLFDRLRADQGFFAGVKNLASVVAEARSAAIQLGSALSTTRATYVDSTMVTHCPAEFNGSNSPPVVGRAAMVVDSNSNTVTFVSEISRSNSAMPPTYLFKCETRDFTKAYDGQVTIKASPATNLASVSTGRYLLTFDSRGFVTNLPGPVAAIGLESADGRKARVLILGSGLSCLEGETDQCRK
ncbi:MAG: prepilin-type N-terminal cleavage/methylation domain-containing protein [Deltaproteobacteria bacterium]|nr:prepilin-type N-terminal cleavage/methylation domain-containing protein [Deltaproteobacteria bacterium]